MNKERIEQIIKIKFDVDGNKNGDATKTKPEFDFIIPTPNFGEKKESYISRCMKAIGKEYDTPQQALAVCYSKLEPKKK